jgi:hypothetical protein
MMFVHRSHYFSDLLGWVSVNWKLD